MRELTPEPVASRLRARWPIIVASVAAAVLIGACHGPVRPANAGTVLTQSRADGGSHIAQAEGGWLTRKVTFANAGMMIEKVSYRSQGLTIFGQVCRPRGRGPFPVLVYNHGGFHGLGRYWNGQACKSAAKNGYVTIASSYRGEDGSQGKVEACLGEVADVLNMIDVAAAFAYTDDDHIVMYGASHGGCITLRAVAAGAPVQAATAIAAPVDWAKAYRYIVRQSANKALPQTARATYRYLAAVVRTAAGGTPDEVPAAYRARSPLYEADALAAWPHPLLMSHGVDDAIVRVSASCRLAAAMGNVSAYHLDATGKGVAQHSPPGCDDIDNWRDGPIPAPRWPNPPYLILYDAAAHTHGKQWLPMLLQGLFFLAQNQPR
ncbi:MAG: alpha/beta fold hydrolase [Salinisphaera sp.]|nr:alpha/beta fold hydrolase [Salinisphaera sp.]